ncbi:inner nuclear membrane protein enriched at telomere/subtelomere region [Actinomortierella wolfii]|nr:inner nuclear membrane protein enriched at telomere/subtelomere region [Actinomortierella wolfii]
MPPKKDIPAYLQPDFDPWTLRMDDIRELLILHKVKPPSGIVRKQALVDSFNEHIRPLAQAAAADTASSTKPSSSKAKDEHTKTPSPTKPASDAPNRKASSETTTTNKTKATESTPTATLRRSGSRTSSSRTPSPTKATAASTSTHKAAKATTEPKVRSKPASSKKAEQKEDQEEPEAPKSKKPSPASRTKTQHAEEKDDTESDTPTRGRRLRKTPSVAEMDDTSDATSVRRRRIPRTNFSKENPFQSASESERSRSRSRSRTKKTTTSRRSSRSKHDDAGDDDGKKDDVFKVPPTPQFARFMQSPKRAAQGGYTYVPRSLAPTSSEDATAHARRYLDSKMPTSKELDLSRATSSMIVDEDQEADEWARSKRNVLKGLCLLLLFIYAYWYRQARFEIGYCTPLDTVAKDSTETSLFGFLAPSCIPCPDHATCLTAHSEPECAPEYLLRPHLLSFGNFLPLTPRCVLNKAKEYRSLQVADAAELLLHQQAGKVECDLHRPANDAELHARQRMSLTELKREILKQKEDSVTHDEFDVYWNIALRELRGRKDSLVFEQATDDEYIRSLKPRKSLACKVRQALVNWIVKFKVFLTFVTVTGLGILMLYRRIQQRSKERRIVHGLVQNVLIKLADQAYYHYVDPIQYPDTAVSVNQLRDALVMDTTFSREQREEIWKKVATIVESNANVLSGAREIRGDPYQVWEWVGPTGVLSSSVALNAAKNDLQQSAPQQQQQHRFGSDLGSHSADSARGRRTSRGAGAHADVMYGAGSSVTGYGGVPRQPPQLGPQGSFFGIRRHDSEFLNPGNSLYPTLSQDDYGTFQE